MHRFYRVLLVTEAPTIGRGYRLIFLHQAGPKWAKLRDVKTLRVARVQRRTWEKMKGHPSTRQETCSRLTLRAVFAQRKNAGKAIPAEAREMMKYTS